MCGDNNHSDVRWLVLDAEAVAIDGAADYLETPTAPAHYRDPEKIAAYVADRRERQLAECALDVDLARIVCLGVADPDRSPMPWLVRDEEDERDALRWLAARVAFPTRIIGFNVLGYDLPLVMRRALYLGVPFPDIELHKFRPGRVVDLMQRLSYQGLLRYRGLRFYAKRFGLAVDDAHTGVDIAALYATGDWDAIAAHCLSDVRLTVVLAERMGVIPTQMPITEVA